MDVTEPDCEQAHFSSFMDEWEREKNVRLNLKYWRLLIEAQTDPAKERASIQVAASCLKSDYLLIGDTREKLEDLPITLKIIRATDEIAVEIVQANAERKAELAPDSKEQTEFVGWLNYYGPSDSAGTKTGEIYSTVVLAAQSFDFLRNRIFLTDTPDIAMEMKLRFPTKENEWDGKQKIDIVSFATVIPHNCYSNFEPFDEPFDEDGEIEPDASSLQLAASKDIAAHLNSIHKTILWASAAIFIAIIVFR